MTVLGSAGVQVVLAAAEPQLPEDVGKSGPLGLFLILVLLAATALLVRSMSRHLKRLPRSFDADDVLASDLPVLVDFTASWCGPCRMVTPVLEQLAAAERDRLRVVQLDVDANPEVTRTYSVLGMPTMSLFRNGEVVTTIVGARPRAAIDRALAPYLAAR